jgi:hypothetical protein
VSFTFRYTLIFVDTYTHTLFLEVNSIFHMLSRCIKEVVNHFKEIIARWKSSSTPIFNGYQKQLDMNFKLWLQTRERERDAMLSNNATYNTPNLSLFRFLVYSVSLETSLLNPSLLGFRLFIFVGDLSFVVLILIQLGLLGN